MVHVDTVVAAQLVRAGYRFIEDVQEGRRDDYESAYAQCFAETFELVLPPTYPEGGQTFRGRAGLKRWIDSIREIWDQWRMEQERFVVAGGQVAVLITSSPAGTSAASRSIARPPTCGRSPTAS